MIDRDERGWSAPETVDLVGVTYRQLDYWARTDLLRPSIVDASGSGTRRRYSHDDLLTLTTIRLMLESGVSLKAIRSASCYLKAGMVAHKRATLVFKPYGVVIAGNDKELLAAIAHESTGRVVSILAVAAIRDELDRKINAALTEALEALAPTG